MFRCLILVCSLFIVGKLYSEEKRQTICLNMIVKDESKVIRRCLDSVINLIDYWVIVDTGSKDGTQEIIKKHLKEIPGELYERSWRNFGENRSEAFLLAKEKGDYILFMDADDVLEFKGAAEFPVFTHDLYHMWRGTEGYSYQKPQIAKGNLPWKWVGVTHEYLACDKPFTSSMLTNVRYVTKEGGASNYDPEKFLKNVRLLEDGLKKEPNNERYMFYLAESYRDAGQKGKALECFQKRVKMGGWDEEVFWSKLQIGLMLRDLGLPSNVVEEALLDAHRFRMHRVEPIYYMAEMFNHERKYDKAYTAIKVRDYVFKPAEKDLLFNADWMDEYGLLFQLSICSYYIGRYQECLEACDKLMAMPKVPESWRKQAEANRAFPIAKIEEKQSAEVATR